MDANRYQSGLTLVEVLVGMLLISLGLSSVLAINSRCIQTLRASRQVAVASQILQQRIEAIRARPWPEISNAQSLQRIMADATDSEYEQTGGDLTEVLTVSPVQASASGLTEGASSFRVRRQNGVAAIERAGDYGKEPTLIITSSVTWTNLSGLHERTLRTVICRAGLTRSGVFGSGVGRPESASSTPAPP